MKITLHFNDLAAEREGRQEERKLTITADVVPDVGDTVDLDANGNMMLVTDRHFLIVNGTLEARIQLR